MAKLRWNSKGKGTSCVAITPADAGTHEYEAFFVGGTGDVKILARDDDTPVTLANIPNGEFVPISIKRVYSTGTDATGIIGILVE